MQGCEETCDDVLGLDAEDDACEMMPTFDCFCKDGFVRDASRACVNKTECEPMPPNECQITNEADCKVVGGMTDCSLDVSYLTFWYILYTFQYRGQVVIEKLSFTAVVKLV